LGVNPDTASFLISSNVHTYDGTAKGVTVTPSPANVTHTVSYSQAGSPVASPTAAGTYDVLVTSTDPNRTGSQAGTLSITKANAVINVQGTTVTYDGQAHGATGTATGVNSEALAGLDLGASFTNVPGGTANWSFTDQTGNYNDASGAVEIVIGKANPTVSVQGFEGVYDGAAKGATGSATGIGGVTLAGLNLGDSFTNVPGGTAHWSFTDTTGNYNDASGSVAIVITKATADLSSIVGFEGVYDGTAKGATGSATGIGGVTLAGLDLGQSFTNVPGGTASWTFTDVTGNYSDASGSVAIVINKAPATISVTGFSGEYDGQPHGVVSSLATGVNGEPLSGLVIDPTTYTNVPGGLVAWTFTDVTGNYMNANGSAAVVITRRPITVTAEPKTKQFGAVDPPLTWQLTSGNLVVFDAIAGSLTRAAGEAVGSYPILQGTLTAGANYDISYVGASLMIGAWHGTGFYQPVGVPNSMFVPALGTAPAVGPGTVWNVAKGGSTIPLKFNLYSILNGAERTATADVKSFGAINVGCVAAQVEEAVEFSSTGGTSLRYDTAERQFIQNWKTPNVGGETCYRVNVTFEDGSAIYAFLKLRR
jgi:hypothetical protein